MITPKEYKEYWKKENEKYFCELKHIVFKALKKYIADIGDDIIKCSQYKIDDDDFFKSIEVKMSIGTLKISPSYDHDDPFRIRLYIGENDKFEQFLLYYKTDKELYDGLSKFFNNVDCVKYGDQYHESSSKYKALVDKIKNMIKGDNNV